MVAAPDQLVWECIKRNNSFLVKKSGNTKRSGTITFSTEPGNLKSIHQLKLSGIANSQAIDVVVGEGNRAQLLKKAASKAGKSPAKTMTTININKDFRRSEGVLAKQTTDVYYRRDLKAAALGKYTKVYQANRRAKGIAKKVPVKMGRKNLKN